MSIVSDVSTDISLVAKKLLEYDEYLSEKAEDCFDMDGKTLESVAKSYSKNLYQFSMKLQDLKSIEDLVKTRLNQVESAKWKFYNEKYSRQLSTRDIQAYIQGEKEYVEMYEVLLEVAHIKKQFEAVVESLKAMNWMISNITKLRIEQMQTEIL